MRHRFVTLLASAAALAALVQTPDASAAPPSGSWAAYGHDYQRTGHADGVGAMTQPPTVAWTLSLGGLLSSGQALAVDVDSDGDNDVVAISGGRVIALDRHGRTLWRGGLNGPRAILGAWDLDGAGGVQVAVDSPRGVLVLDGKDGHLLTTLATEAPVGATFVRESKGGILVLAASRGAVSGYDFRSGTSVSSPIWTITGANQTADLVGDVDGDGKADLVRPLDDGFEVDDPLTGLAKYSLPGMGPAAYFYLYELANVDGVPGDEIVAIDTSYFYSPACGIYVAGVRHGALQTLWSVTASPSVALGNDFISVVGAAADLDHDGRVEVVYSEWSAVAQSWTTVVADGATGATLATIPGQLVQAVADIDGDRDADVVSRAGVGLGNQTPARSTVSAYDFSRHAGAVAKGWTLPNAHVLTTFASESAGVGLPNPVVADFDPRTPGLELIVGQDQSQSNQDTRLAVIDGADGAALHGLSVAPTVHPAVVTWGKHLTTSNSDADLVLANDVGKLQLLDRTLTVRRTMSAGTYANWLYAVAGASGSPNLFASTSNDHLLWMDGSRLQTGGGPVVGFDQPNTVSTVVDAEFGNPRDPVVYLGGTQPILATFEQGPSAITIVGRDASANEAWRTALDPGTIVIAPGGYALDLTGDGHDDLLLNLEDINAINSVAVFDGVTGALVRTSPVSSIKPGADELTTGTLVDVNGDGHLDLVAPEDVFGVMAIDLNKQPFSELWYVPGEGTQPPALNGTVGSAQLVAGTAQLFRSNGNNGFGPYERISSAGQVLAVGDQGLPANAEGFDENAAVTVARGTTGASDLVSAGTANVALSRIRRIAGDTMGTVWTVYVAAGAVTSSPPATAYPLHDPVAFDVDGNGEDDVVVGSDDGYVYAVSSTDGSLKFAVNLGAPVAHLVAANVDADPALELVASLTDGRLVALDDAYSATQGGQQGQPDAGCGRGDPDGHGDGDPRGDLLLEEGPGTTASAGGSGCGTAGNGGSSEWAVALVGACALVLYRRKRA